MAPARRRSKMLALRALVEPRHVKVGRLVRRLPADVGAVTRRRPLRRT